MAIVRDLLKIKGDQVWSASPDTSVKAALQLMSEKNVGALVVLEGGKIVGIFSERDFARHMVSVEKLSDTMLVKHMMTQPVFYAHPDQTVDECMAVMTVKHFRHLPVLENDRLIGLRTSARIYCSALLSASSAAISLKSSTFKWITAEGSI